MKRSDKVIIEIMLARLVTCYLQGGGRDKYELKAWLNRLGVEIVSTISAEITVVQSIELLKKELDRYEEI